MKRLIASILILSIMCSNAIAFASGRNTESQVGDLQQMYSPAYISMVEMERKTIYNELEVQLAQQDALHLLPVFKEVVDRNIDATYYAKTASATQVYAPNGGVVQYGDTSFDVVVTYMNEEATDDLYSGRNSTTSAVQSGALSTILSIVTDKYFGVITATLSAIYGVATARTWEQINNGTKCCYSISVNEYGDGIIRTTLHHWASAYNMNVPDKNQYTYVDYTTY